MKILIFSDSHGSFLTMEKAWLMNKDAKYVLFLGDGISDIERLRNLYPEMPVIAVRGNCDFGAGDYPTERVLPVGNIKIFMCHGHTYGVKGGYGGLIKAAENAGCAVALCGHTHTPDTRYIDDMQTVRYVENPGSAHNGSLDGGRFGIMEMQGDGILFSNAELPHCY